MGDGAPDSSVVQLAGNVGVAAGAAALFDDVLFVLFELVDELALGVGVGVAEGLSWLLMPETPGGVVDALEVSAEAGMATATRPPAIRTAANA